MYLEGLLYKDELLQGMLPFYASGELTAPAAKGTQARWLAFLLAAFPFIPTPCTADS